MCCFRPPKTRQPTVAPPNPMTSVLHATMGSDGAMIWWTADLPTEVEGKAAGRAATAHVGCCVCCVLCMVRAAFFSYQWYLLCRKPISDRPKLPILAHSWTKMHHQTTQMIRHRNSHHGVRILAMPYYESCNNWDRTSLGLPGDFLAISQILLALPRKSRIKLANKYFCRLPPIDI